METTWNTMMEEGTEDGEEEENKIVSACIIEEVNPGKAIRLSTTRQAKNGVALDTGFTSSVAGELWLREYMQLLTKKAKGKVKGIEVVLVLHFDLFLMLFLMLSLMLY